MKREKKYIYQTRNRIDRGGGRPTGRAGNKVKMRGGNGTSGKEGKKKVEYKGSKVEMLYFEINKEIMDK